MCSSDLKVKARRFMKSPFAADSARGIVEWNLCNGNGDDSPVSPASPRRDRRHVSGRRAQPAVGPSGWFPGRRHGRRGEWRDWSRIGSTDEVGRRADEEAGGRRGGRRPCIRGRLPGRPATTGGRPAVRGIWVVPTRRRDQDRTPEWVGTGAVSEQDAPGGAVIGPARLAHGRPDRHAGDQQEQEGPADEPRHIHAPVGASRPEWTQVGLCYQDIIRREENTLCYGWLGPGVNAPPPIPRGMDPDGPPRGRCGGP